MCLPSEHAEREQNALLLLGGSGEKEKQFILIRPEVPIYTVVMSSGQILLHQPQTFLGPPIPGEKHPALGARLCWLIWLISLCRQKSELFPTEGNSEQYLEMFLTALWKNMSPAQQRWDCTIANSATKELRGEVSEHWKEFSFFSTTSQVGRSFSSPPSIL